MKKLTLIILAFVLVTSACEKDEEETPEPTTTDLEPTATTLEPIATQRGFAVEYTATWCEACGNWGAQRMHKYGNEAPHGALITVHALGDPLYIPALYASFSKDRPVVMGFPTFWVGDAEANSDDAMKTLLASGDADAGIDLSYEKDGNKLTVKTMTKFFSPASGDYYLSVLLCEDGIDGSASTGAYKQNGTSDPNYKHDYVLRASSVDGNAYGVKISSNPSDGSTVEKDYTFTLDPSWKNVYPVAIVWRKDASSSPSYKYINSYKK